MQDNRPGSVDLKYPMKEADALKANKPEEKTLAQQAAEMGVSERKLISMRAYAEQLFRERKGIKPKQVAALVAKKYNVKIV